MGHVLEIHFNALPAAGLHLLQAWAGGPAAGAWAPAEPGISSDTHPLPGFSGHTKAGCSLDPVPCDR